VNVSSSTGSPGSTWIKGR